MALAVVVVSLVLAAGLFLSQPVFDQTTTRAVGETTSSTDLSSMAELGLTPQAEVTAVDQNGTQLVVPVVVNGTLDGYTPLFVTLLGNASASVACESVSGLESVATGPFGASAGSVVICAYGLATSRSTTGTVSLIVNTDEPVYGPYAYGQIQITSPDGQVLQTGVTGASGSAMFTVPANSEIFVEWLGVGGPSSPAAAQAVSTGSTTPLLITLWGNPAQTDSPCFIVNEEMC